MPPVRRRGLPRRGAGPLPPGRRPGLPYDDLQIMPHIVELAPRAAGRRRHRPGHLAAAGFGRHDGIVGFCIGGRWPWPPPSSASRCRGQLLRRRHPQRPLRVPAPRRARAAAADPWLGLFGDQDGHPGRGGRAPATPPPRRRCAPRSCATPTPITASTATQRAHDPDAAADAWARTLVWFAATSPRAPPSRSDPPRLQVREAQVEVGLVEAAVDLEHLAGDVARPREAR